MASCGRNIVVFNEGAKEKLCYYVYGLFDSVDKDLRLPFYIGKGRGNRVFSHVAVNLNGNDDDNEPLSRKLQCVEDIKADGREVIHKIIRFGLSEEEAFKIEATLIDIVNFIKPGTLTNEISGQGVAEGIYDARDLAAALNAEELNSECPLLLIKIEKKWTDLIRDNHTSNPCKIYDAVKCCWKVDAERAQRAECVLVVARGLVRAAIKPTGWEPCNDGSGRKRMTGWEPAEKCEQLVGMSVARIFAKGSQNPIRHLNC